MSVPMPRHPFRRGFLLITMLTGGLFLALSFAHARQVEIDFNRARQLRQRFLRGEQLSDEDRAYLERAKAAFQKKQAGAVNGARLKEAGFSAGQVQVAYRFSKSDSTAKPWFLKRTL